MSAIELADYHWLVSEQAVPWLRRAADASEPLSRLTKSLRRESSSARTHLILEQIDLRRRARDKFSQADRIFFTAKGLEQATDERLAQYKASRFARDAPVADLCCGVGGDLLALAVRGPAIGVDRDEVCALFAAANCAFVGANASRVLAADARDFAFENVAAWHLDPDRRAHGRRTSQPVYYEPGPEMVDGALHRCSSAAVKLAPAAEIPESWREVCEREWLVSRGECRQQVAWFGPLASRLGRRSATVVDADSEAVRTVVERSDAPISLATSVRRFVFEPNPAVLAAGLESSIAAEHALQMLAVEGGYLTGDSPVQDAALAAFEVTDVLPFDTRRLKALLRTRAIGRLEVKKRGVENDPAQTQSALRVSGDNQATLLITRLAKKVIAILAQRCPPTP